MSAEPMGARITGMEHKVRDIKDAVDRIANAHSGNQNVTTIKLDGGRSIITSLVIGLVGGCLLGLSVAVVGWVSWALSRQDSMNNWTAQEVTAIRSYITNGKLKPMEPRPFGPEEKEKTQ
jgi:hypothetical protein